MILVNFKIFIISIIVIPVFVEAQKKGSYISRIQSYIKFIDSADYYYHNLDSNYELNYKISRKEGDVSQDGFTIGGFDIRSLSNKSSDTLFRIEYHETGKKNLNKKFYYKSNHLVFARLELEDYRNKKLFRIYEKEEYYKDGKLFFRHVKSNRQLNNSKYNLKLDLYKNAIEYLAQFKKLSHSG